MKPLLVAHSVLNGVHYGTHGISSAAQVRCQLKKNSPKIEQTLENALLGMRSISKKIDEQLTPLLSQQLLPWRSVCNNRNLITFSHWSTGIFSSKMSFGSRRYCFFRSMLLFIHYRIRFVVFSSSVAVKV